MIALVEENCTSCMLCARECPDWCIYIDSHKETLPAPEGGRARQRNVLDRFAIDFSLCMYCGICIEVCPFDALFWSPEFEYADGDIRNLLHEKDRLAEWVETVPPPPAHEVGAEPPKELSAAPRRTPASDRAAPRAAPPADRPAPRSTPIADRPAARSAPMADPAAPPDAPAMGRAAPAPPPTAGQPPGASPPSEEPGSAGTSAESGSSGTSDDAGSAGVVGTSDEAASPSSAGPSGATDLSHESGTPPSTETGPVEPQLSTGSPSGEELSTGSGAPLPESEPEEQTSAAEPRRRRMADPRSIRPPGRLKPDETQESEEET